MGGELAEDTLQRPVPADAKAWVFGMTGKLEVRWQLLGEVKGPTTEMALWQEQFVLRGQMISQFGETKHTLAAVSACTCLDLSTLYQRNSVSVQPSAAVLRHALLARELPSTWTALVA